MHSEALISVDTALIKRGAELLAGRKWASAADAYRRACAEGEVGTLPFEEQLRRNLAINMGELVGWRPQVVGALEAAPADTRFTMDVTPVGRMSVAFQGKRLIEGDDPIRYLASVMQQLKAHREAGSPLAILGSGDGYVLMGLAKHPVKLTLGREQCVHFFEPNVGNLLLCLMIHDMTGETGPIRQKRFQWWIGADCVAKFREGMFADSAMPCPAVNVAMLPDGPTLAKAAAGVLEEIVAWDKRLAREVREKTGLGGVERFIDATSTRPSRKPRALLLTTRATTVLQYSTKDCAEALRELGWDAEVVMEATGWHTLTKPMIRESLLRRDPDLILQLDHNRSEHGELFGGGQSQVPFVSWAQDHLPNLTNPEAGRAISSRDYFLTDLGPWYERVFGYPGGQIIPVGKLTKVPALPEGWEKEWGVGGPDFTYVSNASKLPETAAAELVKAFEPIPEAARLAEAAARRLLGLYAEGKSFAGTVDMHGVIAGAAEELGMKPESWRAGPELVTELFERVNNLCYRHQALTWLAEIADEMGLGLAIYGTGWEKHPRLAKYSKGYVGYGAELEKLTRASKINFQIVPYFCLHQRLLDGLAAGGFFLVRSHASDKGLRKLGGFLDEWCPGAQNVPEARGMVDGELAKRLGQLVEENGYIADRLDAVELCRIYQEMGMFRGGAEMPPRIDEVSFGGKEELRALIEKFMPDGGLRRKIAMEQRTAVAETLSYRAGLSRVIAEVHKRLVAEQERMRSVA